ncbi:MAG: chromosome segregation protein SMC [Nitrospinae bacterium]|nr:chromosome segregation protein SMC [Nitrospinota bacterium]
MYFKSIEMRGFKSFVDETRLVFEPGITVIVGPNGCGKSNIADGIRWVLGEQSAKMMRGVKMEDFIFNGSSSRKATGFAEVSLTISNADGIISTHPYSEYSEVTVTRKLYRTGESEYFINKVPCRLKDIVDVFLDTGVSTRAFSIIEQGQVTKLINSKPEERRFIIEEAAGVMKYKHRRNAALNKLEASQQNLLRIQDILGELERQRNSLHRQAKKAERYKEFKTEIKASALVCFASEFQGYVSELSEVSSQLTAEREKEAIISAELSTRRNDSETLAAQITREEKSLSELREERQTITSSIERNDHHRGLLSRQSEDLAAANDNALREITQLEGEVVTVDETLTLRHGERETISGEIGSIEGLFSGLKETANGVRSTLASKQEEFGRATRDSLRILEEIGKSRDRLSSIRARMEMASGQVESLAAREGEASSTIAAISAKIESLTEELGKLTGQITSGKENNAAIREKLKAAETELKAAEELVRSVESEFTRQTSRLDSLKELDRNLEGFGEGVRKLMKKKMEGSGALSGVRGLLADGVRVAPEFEAALGAILGDKLEAVITENSSSALSAIGEMKNTNMGRASFLAPDISPALGVEPHSVRHPSFVGWAKDIVTLSAGVPAQVNHILSGVAIARDLVGAMEIRQSATAPITVVTLEGDVVEASGVVSGGSPKATAGAGIVARKRMIEELEASIREVESKKSAAIEKRAMASQAVGAAKEELAASEEALRKLEMGNYEVSRELQREEAEKRRAESQLASLKAQREPVLAEREKLSASEVEITASMDQVSAKKDELEAQATALQAEIEQLRKNLEETSASLTREEVRLTEARGRLNNVQADLKRLEGARADLGNRLARLKDSIGGFGAKQEEIKRSMDTLLSENADSLRKKDSLTQEINQMAEAIEEKVAAKTGLEQTAREMERALEECRGLVNSLSIRNSELELRLENVIEKADVEFNIPIDDMRNTSLEGVDLEEGTRRLAFLRSELSRIGDVNMSALEEYEEVNGRFEHMKNQHADLVASIANLRKTIESINETTAEMFNETFKVVSANFENVFKRLFGGGRAEMRLVQEEGQAEPGLEIFVQPPGKKVQNLNLLSAGEKAMTAISLLFAVFMTKPSPFCLLDEVDAPLDEANIFRFRDMLMEMKKNTQFIIITHNQKTMSFAERMYGITQEEEGVSKILSVNLVDHRPEEELELTAA